MFFVSTHLLSVSGQNNQTANCQINPKIHFTLYQNTVALVVSPAWVPNAKICIIFPYFFSSAARIVAFLLQEM